MDDGYTNKTNEIKLVNIFAVEKNGETNAISRFKHYDVK
jgi:hypothetical protein